jgi:hypothetical protein
VNGAEERSVMKPAFKIWLAIMVPTIIVLTIIGYTCSGCVQ